MSRERDDRASVPEKGGRAKLYDLVEHRVDGSSVADNPVVKTLREQSEILAQESNYLTLKRLVDEKKAVAQGKGTVAITRAIH